MRCWIDQDNPCGRQHYCRLVIRIESINPVLLLMYVKSPVPLLAVSFTCLCVDG